MENVKQLIRHMIEDRNRASGRIEWMRRNNTDHAVRSGLEHERATLNILLSTAATLGLTDGMDLWTER